jgi:hypothetical protein
MRVFLSVLARGGNVYRDQGIVVGVIYTALALGQIDGDWLDGGLHNDL